MITNSSRHLLVRRLPYILLTAVLTISLLLGLAIFDFSPQAYAVTSAEKQAELDEALTRLDALQTEINQLATNYDEAVIAHAEAEAKMFDALARELAAKERIATLQEQLGNRAAQTYRKGNTSFMDVLFGAQSFVDFMTAIDLVNRVNESDVQLVLETKEVKAEAEEARVEYTTQEQIAREKQEQIATIKAERETAEGTLQEEIAGLETEVLELQLKEEIAAEAARQAAANLGIASYGDVSEGQLARLYAMNFRYPFSGAQPISSPFGPRSFDGYHLGTDFAAPGGTPILSIGSGTIIAAGSGGAMGNYVIIAHGDRITSTYMHASALNCSKGQTVSPGDVIAYVGTTGNSTGNHLHLQVEIDGMAVNPMLFL